VREVDHCERPASLRRRPAESERGRQSQERRAERDARRALCKQRVAGPSGASRHKLTMKNQYNFLRTIDTPNSATSASSPEGTACDKRRANGPAGGGRVQMKSSLSKLHNLVASRFSAGSNSSNQTNPNERERRPAGESDGGPLLEASCANGSAGDRGGQAARRQPLGEQQLGFRRRQQQLQPPTTTTTAAAASATMAPSLAERKQGGERLVPELAKCYEEIDQIYDYIRGLAPLPLQLRKIKSIDFEQLEQREQQQSAAASGRARPAAGPIGPASGPVRGKVRQRVASDDEQLRRPCELAAARVEAQQGPLPIKVTTVSDERPNLKRVESMNLDAKAELGSPIKPAYLIGGPQRSQLFRLPRAHSTSTLNKADAQASSARPKQAPTLEGAHLGPTDPAKVNQRQAATTRTLPALRLTKTSILYPSQSASASLGRLRTQREAGAERRVQEGKLQGRLGPASGKPLDLIESFVDDDDVSSVASKSAPSNSSSASPTSASADESSSGRAKKQSARSPSTPSSCSSSSSSSNSTSNSSNGSSGSGTCKSTSESDSISQATSDNRSEMGGAELRPKGSASGSSKSNGFEKWGEKSHSDYENETASLNSEASQSSSMTNLSNLNSEAQPKLRAKRQNSSGVDTIGSPENQGSGCSSSGRPISVEEAELAAGKRDRLGAEKEHIYEQIPAHRSARQLAEASRRPQSLPFNQSMAYSYDKFKQHQRQRILQRQQQQQQQQVASSTSARPFNYPMAYAQNVAQKQPQKQVNSLLARQTQAHSARNLANLQRQYHAGDTFPVGLGATVRPLHPRPYYVGSQPHSLDHRLRLSMNNLHLLPYLSNQPLALGVYPMDQSKLSRASSSNRVNRMRAPRLSPGQLIAQIQMPRAVSKRQNQAQPDQMGPFVPIVRQRRQPSQPQPVFVWQNSERNIELAKSQEQTHRPYAAAAAAATNGSGSRRNNARRLTAIGIEEALDCVSRAAPTRSRLDEDNGARALQGAQRKQAAYFEPPQLTKAPLIDDDDPQTAGSDDAQDGLASGGKGLLAHQKAAAFMQTRYLNSISDLHSLSSTSDEEESRGSASDDLEPNSADQRRVESRGRLAKRSSDEGGDAFVSSRSFIKCYYGKERQQAVSAEERELEQKRPVAAAEMGTKKPTEVGEKKRRGSDKLLSLIGLNSGQRRLNRSRASKSGSGSESSNQTSGATAAAARVTSSPIATLFASNQRGTRKEETGGHLVGEFLSSEGPILVRDRRIAALRSDLVRHYEHPTVQVAKVPNFAAQPSNSRPEGLSRAALKLEQAGSTNTTNSTSSYEAAIKNSRERANEPTRVCSSETSRLLSPSKRQTNFAGAQSGSKATNSGAKSHSCASTGGQSLIKVPKLSKQSHLLNRPLPKPPLSPALAAGSARRMAAAASQAGGKHGVPSKAQQAPQSKRKILVATNYDPSAAVLASLSKTSAEKRQQRTCPSSAAQAQPKPSASLSPLSVSLTTQPSPTVTTGTSSGISSRLTAGTHLASSASSQRSATNSARRQVRALAAAETRPAESAGGGGRSLRRSDDFALMDDSDGRENLSPELGGKGESAEEGGRIRCNSLRLFDEKFSTNFSDQHLVSSSDSLLESINFSGTQNRKWRPSAKQSDTKCQLAAVEGGEEL